MASMAWMAWMAWMARSATEGLHERAGGRKGARR
jgi:hypothetical protein